MASATLIGQILSHYEVIEKIGRGGMGGVFRARDKKLNRDVAIKILPEAFASIETPAADSSARFSPGDRFVAYESNESGQPEIYVCFLRVGAGSGRSRKTAGEDPSGGRMAKSSFSRRPTARL